MLISVYQLRKTNRKLFLATKIFSDNCDLVIRSLIKSERASFNKTCYMVRLVDGLIALIDGTQGIVIVPLGIGGSYPWLIQNLFE